MKKHTIPYTPTKSNRQCLSETYYDTDSIYQPKNNMQSSFYEQYVEHNPKLLSNIKNIQRQQKKPYNQCSRCLKSSVDMLRCINCFGRWFCSQCSQLVHKTGKFQFHKIMGRNQPLQKQKSKSTKGIIRKNSQSIRNKESNYEDENKKSCRVLFGTPKITNKYLTEQLDSIAQFEFQEAEIQQNWAKIARNVQLKFEEIHDLLKNKLISIEKEIGLKKQKQIIDLKQKIDKEKYKNKNKNTMSKVATNSPIISGKTQSRFMFSPQSANYIMNQLNDCSELQASELAHQPFDQLANMIKKMEIKTMIKRQKKGSTQKYFVSRDRNKLQKSSNNKSHVLVSDNFKKFQEEKKSSKHIHKKVISMVSIDDDKNTNKTYMYSQASKNTNSDLSVTHASFKGLEQQQNNNFSLATPPQSSTKSPQLSKFNSQKYIWNDSENQPQRLFHKPNTFIKKAKNRDGFFDRSQIN